MEIEKKTLRRIFFGIVGCIFLYWLLHETERVTNTMTTIQGILAPFEVGAALAFVLNVPMRGIERQLRKVKKSGLRRVLALLLTVLSMVLILALVFYLLIPQIGETVRNLAPQMLNFFKNAQDWVVRFLEDHPDITQWITANTDLEKLDWANLIQQAVSMVGNSVTAIVNEAFSAIGSITSTIVNAVIGIVFAVYCLFRKEILARQARRMLYAFLPEKVADNIIRVMRMTNAAFSNFISGQCLEACILGGLFAISMLIFRMPYIPLVSVLVAVTALVPVVGAFVGCIFGAFFILVDSPIQAVWFVVMFLVLQQIENNMIYPRVVGTSIGLPGMWVLVAVTIGGELMGVGGMLVMIPLASVLYALLREITDHRLEKKNIDRDKLEDYPPELQSRFQEKREQFKLKRALRKGRHLPSGKKK